LHLFISFRQHSKVGLLRLYKVRLSISASTAAQRAPLRHLCQTVNRLRPNSITLSGRRQVRSWYLLIP